jgi:hypothetical protein
LKFLVDVQRKTGFQFHSGAVKGRAAARPKFRAHVHWFQFHSGAVKGFV